MSFFFFKAGYFNKSVTAMPSRDYVTDKAKRLLLPYLSAGTIGSAIYFFFYPFLVDKYHAFPGKLEWDHIWRSSDFYGNPPAWFLFSFFAAYVIIHFLEKLRHGLLDGRVRPHIAQATSMVYGLFPLIGYWLYTMDNPLWLSLNNVFMGVFFFELGRTWHRIIDNVDRRTMNVISVALVICFVIGNIIFHDASYTMSCNRFDGGFIPVMINTTAILCGLSGLLIANGVGRVPAICYIGEHSMVYFISHFPILFFYKYVHLCFGRSIYGRWDDAIILLPAIFMICSWLVPYIEKVPMLSGRWSTSK